MARHPLIVGRPVLIVVDIQEGGFSPGGVTGIPVMPGFANRLRGARRLVDAARAGNVPVIFFQEVHRATLIDFGRELDGVEGVHALETSPGTPVAKQVLGVRDDDIVISKRRYSCFFGTDLKIVLNGLKAETLILCGALTDVCVHYTFVDGHQNDYYVRVAEECTAGSTVDAHQAALAAMEYLQTGARRSTAEIVSAFQDLAPFALAG